MPSSSRTCGLIAIGLWALVFVGCRSSPSDPSLAHQLEGSWKLVGEPRAPDNRLAFTRTSDSAGTFTYTVPSILTFTFKGTWQLEGRTLTWQFREVPDLVRWGEQLGFSKRPDKVVFTIVRITDQELVLKQPRVPTEERYERLPAPR